MATMSRVEFDALYDELARPGDESALEWVTPQRIAAAAALVRHGVTVPLGLPVDTGFGPARANPADHHMTLLPTADQSGPVHFAKDYIGLDFHNEGHSHLDVLSHVSFRGVLRGGVPESSVTPDGPTSGTVAAAGHGLAGRGVLIDVPRVRSVRWLEPGQQVTLADIDAATKSEGIDPQPGDILLIRTGHTLHVAESPPWDTTVAKPGLHPEVARYLAREQVAVLGSDGNNDTAPSGVDGVGFPIHVLALQGLGVLLLDYLSFEEIAAACEHYQRWAFFCVIAPLRIPHGTGSPVNPIAIL